MLASRADSFLSGSIEVFKQPDKPPTSENHGPRELPSCVVLCCFATSNKRLVGPEKNACSGKAMLAYPMHAIFFNYLASL